MSVFIFISLQRSISFLAAVTINNGIDALSHCIEGYLSEKSQPLTDSLALETIRLITRYLPKVLEDPQNSKYRSKMSYTALLGGMVIAQAGMGLVHQMGYHLTLNLGMAHGEANGVLPPSVCEFVLSQRRNKLDSLARGLGEAIEGLEEKGRVERTGKNIKGFTS